MIIENLINRVLSKEWIIDFDVSRHITPDELVFINKRKINTYVIIANGEVLKIRIIGDVEVDLGERIISIKNVLYVPELDANLLSIAALNQRGFTVLFNKTEVEIKRENTSIATEIMRGRTYLLKTIDTALLITEGGEASVSNSMKVIIKASKLSNSNEIPSTSINQTKNICRL